MKKRLFLSLLALVCCVSGAWATRLFMVGDATPKGWSVGTDQMLCTELIETGDGIFTWTGKLRVGGEGFKVSTALGQWGDWHPSTDFNSNLDEVSDVMREGNPDTKWHVSAEGVYTVTINWNTKEISAVKETYELQKVGDVYQIATAEDLFYFSQWISHDVISNTSKAELTADIDYTAAKYKYASIGCAQGEGGAFYGEFNGNGHKITINMADLRARTGLFAFVNHPVIKNLWVDGTITMKSRNCAGGLGGRCDGDGTRIDGVLSTVTINDAQSGDGTIGGLFANVESNNVLISNCAFLGTINAPQRDGNGGLVGWCGSGKNITFKNCLVKPASVSWNGGAAVGRNKPTISNVYALGIDNGSFEYEGSFGSDPTAEQLANGEFCYWLNESASGAEHWYQTIGTDANPFPIATGHQKVYANGEFYCDGVTSKGTTTYANTSSSVVDAHVYGEDGLCTGGHSCHAGKEPAAVDGVYQIANIGNLVWFSAHVNGGATEANAVLTADIDQQEHYYVPIGSTENVYKGHFNGQYHKVLLGIDNPGYDNQGMFGVITDGVLIENLIVDGYVNGNNYVGGIAGATNGGSSNAKKTTIKNCGNNAGITANGANGGGILGVNMGGSASLHFENVFNRGGVDSKKEGGAMSGWSGGGWSYFVNCYNSGVVTNNGETSHDFTRHNGTSINNCYYMDDTQTDAQEGVKAFTSGEGQNGALCVKLGGDFTQTLPEDEYPTFGHNKVYAITVGATGWATYVAPATVDLSNFVNCCGEAYTVRAIESGCVKLGTAKSIEKGTAILVKNDEGTYYINDCQDASMDENFLVAAWGDVVSDGTLYVLAQVDGKVGFHKATAGTHIPDGKGYLQIPSGAKAFYAIGEGETDGIKAVNNEQLTVNNGKFMENNRVVIIRNGQKYNVNGQVIK